MKVKELIAQLSKYSQDHEIDIVLNVTPNSDEETDIQANLELMGDTDTAPTLIVYPQKKSGGDFETIIDLLLETEETLHIEMNKDGMYVFVDKELRRELDFKQNLAREDIKEKAEVFIQKLVEIL
jgi:hypothetical protein